MLLDDGFAAAPTWDARVASAAERLTEAGRDGRTAAVAALSDGPQRDHAGDRRRRRSTGCAP